MALNKKEIEEITRKHYHDIYKFCCAKLLNADTAFDVTQNTFLLLVKKSKELKNDNILAWLYKTAQFKCRELYREEEKRAALISFDEIEETLGTADTAPVFDEIQQKMLSVLNDDEKRLFTLLYIERESISLIAQEYGTTERNIRQKKSRIRSKIRSKMKYTDFFMLVLTFKLFGHF